MKAKLATWYILTLLLGCLSESFCKSKNINKINKTASFDVTTGMLGTSQSLSVINTMLNKDKSVPKYLTRFAFDQVSDKKSSRRLKEAPDKAHTTNATIIGNVKKEDEFQSKLSPIGDYVYGSLLLVTCIPAVLGNGCALTLFQFRHRKLIPMEVFFINLSVADILLSVASYPMSIFASFQHRWNFRESGCTIYAFCCYFLSLSSIYTITAMAITRYLITCKPAQGNRINCWTGFKMVAMGYLLAFLWAAMPLFGFGNYGVEPFGVSCTLDWVANDKASRIYFVLVTIFCVLLPIFILLFCYSQIIMLVRQSTAMMKSIGHTRQNKNGSSIQLTWISGLISTGFVIAWFPYTIACLWTSFKGELVLPIWLTPAPALFAKSSIVYNPIIYIFITARYRKDFYGLIQYISCKSGVRETETNQNVDTATGTGEDRSTFRCGDLNSNGNGMENDTIETSNSYVPGIMQETGV